MNSKVEAHHSGAGSNQVQIREGIFESSLKKDMERDGPPKIPKNFSALNGIQTVKTSVRKTRDYPVLQERFNKNK